MHIPAKRTDPSNKNPLVLKIIFIKLAPVSIGSIDWKFSIINELFRCYCISTIEFYKMFNFTNYPMLWNISDPVDAGGTEGGVWVEATGDDTRNLALFQLVNQLNLAVNLCNRRINLLTLLIQPCRYRLLLSKRR